MKFDAKPVAIGVVLVALAALGIGWWIRSHHQVWREELRTAPARSDQYLAAKRLLEKNGYRIRAVSMLDHLNLDKLPDGTMIIGGSEGVMTSTQGDKLLRWTSRGNTLVFQPRTATVDEAEAAEAEAAEVRELAEIAAKEAAAANKDDDASAADADEDASAAQDASVTVDEAANAKADGSAAASAAAQQTGEHEQDESAPPARETDPLGTAAGVRWQLAEAPRGCSNLTTRTAIEEAKGKCPPGTMRGVELRTVPLPGRAPVLVNIGRARVVELGDRLVPEWQDNQGSAVRAYRFGKGLLVVAPEKLFRNDKLREQDHGALLLGLAGLNRAHKQVLLIEARDFAGWRELLWVHYKMLLIGLAALLALLFWAAVRRFGPVLPDAEPGRRALMEHIDASGAWLWKADGGRQLLLQAVRNDLLGTLQRRAPALLRLGQNSQHEELARLCGVPVQHVAHALHDDAAALGAEFTRQIHTLQTLRKHYER